MRGATTKGDGNMAKVVARANIEFNLSVSLITFSAKDMNDDHIAE